MRPRAVDAPSSNPEDVAERRYHATRCRWTTNGRGCLLTGTLSSDTGGALQADGTVSGPRAFCPFHHDAITAGQSTSDTRAFSDWLEQHVNTFRGDSDFTRHGLDTLWAAAIGNTPLPKRRREEAPADQLRPATSAQRSIAFAKAKAMLAGKFE